MDFIKIIGIGDNVVDKYLHLNKMFPGGNAVNVPVLCHRYGMEAAYIGCLGNDYAGKHIYKSLREEGIDITHVKTVDGPNAYARVTLVEGDRVFLPGNAGVSTSLTLSDEDYNYIRGFDLVHTSVYSNIDKILPIIKEIGIPVSYDYSDIDEHASMEDTLPYVDFAFFSASEKSTEEIKEFLYMVNSKGPKLMLATRGSKGAILYYEQKYYEQPIVETKVIDTLGAGDSFISRLLVGILRNDKTEEVLKQAATEAAKVCTYYGAFGYGISL